MNSGTAFIAIAVSSTRAQSVERSLKQGETMTLGAYRLTFEGVEQPRPQRVKHV